MPDKPLTKSELILDLTRHSGYQVLMEDVFEGLIKEEEKHLWKMVGGPQARFHQLEIVSIMKAYLEKAQTKINNTIKNAQQQQKGTRDVQETTRTGRRD